MHASQGGKQEEGGGGQEAFKGSVESAKTFVAVVSGIFNGKRDQHAHIVANSNGLRISVENQAKTLHAVAYLKPSLFSTYEFFGDQDTRESEALLHPSKSQAALADRLADTCFRINLASLLDCLTVFGASELDATSLHLAYMRDSRTLRLLLEEGGILTECEICTIPPDDELDFPGIFRESPVPNKAWIRAEHLREAFAELADLPGASTVTIYMAPRAPHFRLSAVGNAGSCTVDFPKGSETFVTFDSTQEQLFHYHLSLLHFAVRGLAKAEETFIRINEVGMLNLNHKVVRALDGEESFISFVLLPDEVEPMSGDEDGEDGHAFHGAAMPGDKDGYQDGFVSASPDSFIAASDPISATSSSRAGSRGEQERATPRHSARKASQPSVVSTPGEMRDLFGGTD